MGRGYSLPCRSKINFTDAEVLFRGTEIICLKKIMMVVTVNQQSASECLYQTFIKYQRSKNMEKSHLHKFSCFIQLWRIIFRVNAFLFDVATYLNYLMSGRNRGFSCQNNRSARGFAPTHSGAGSGRELFKPSKDAASLLVCTRKKFLVGGCGFFVSDISGGLTGHLAPLHLALGPNC